MDQAFARSVETVQSFGKTTTINASYDQKLSLYAYFKQATEGGPKTSRPSVLAVLERAKYDAWKRISHLNADEAKAGYTQIVLRILRGFKDRQESIVATNQILSLLPPGQGQIDSHTDTSESDYDEDTVAPLQSSQYTSVRHQPPTSLIAAVRSQNSKGNREAQVHVPGPSNLEDDDGSSTEDGENSDRDILNQNSLAVDRNRSHPQNINRAASPASSLGPYQQEWLERQQKHTNWDQQQQMASSSGLRSPIYGNSLPSPAPFPMQPTRRPSDSMPPRLPLQNQLQRTPNAPNRPESAQSQHLYGQPNNPPYQPLRSPIPRPGTGASGVPLESTLQAIHTSLTMLHDRISALERRKQATQAPSFLQTVSQSVRSIFNAMPWPFKQQLAAANNNGQGFGWTLWERLRDVSLLAIALGLILGWKRNRSIAEIWRGWLHLAQHRKIGRRVVGIGEK